MEINIVGDLISFGVSILSGLAIGIFYDLYRIFRRFSKPSKIMSYIEDFLFWMIIGFIFFILLVKLTGGVLRGFVFIGASVGVSFYLFFLSKYVYYLFYHTFKLILDVLSEIINVIASPFKKSVKYTKGKIKKVFILVKVFFKEVGKYRKIISGKK